MKLDSCISWVDGSQKTNNAPSSFVANGQVHRKTPKRPAVCRGVNGVFQNQPVPTGRSSVFQECLGQIGEPKRGFAVHCPDNTEPISLHVAGRLGPCKGWGQQNLKLGVATAPG